MFNTQRKVGRALADIGMRLSCEELGALDRSLARGKWTIGVETDGNDERVVLRCIGTRLGKGRPSRFDKLAEGNGQ